MTRLLPVVVVAAAAGCAAPEEARFGVVTPRELAIACNPAPADFTARVWVSGYDEPFPLVVDVTAGTTAGTVEIAPGVVRTLTIDWFVPLGREDGIDLVVAQASGPLDLSSVVEETAAFEVADEPEALACVDLREGAEPGAQVVTFDGVQVPLCDLDDSCAGGVEPQCTNLNELCEGGDPFDRAVDPP